MTNSAEKLKQHKRLLNASVRELERERSKLERQEKQLLAEIKKMAKASQLVLILPNLRVECSQNNG